MAGEDYSGFGTVGGRWGCALAALVGIPLIGFLYLAAAMGDCVPGEECRRGLPWLLMLPALLIAAIVGFGSRALINRFLKRRSNDR